MSSPNATKATGRTPRRDTLALFNTIIDSGRPPGVLEMPLDPVETQGPAAALGYRDLLPSSVPSSPALESVPLGSRTSSKRASLPPSLTSRPALHRRESSVKSIGGTVPYSSWASLPMRADPRHGNSRMFTFMPSANRVPVPPPLEGEVDPISPIPSPQSECPPAFIRPELLLRRRSSEQSSSVTTSPSGESYFTRSSGSGTTYFSSRSHVVQRGSFPEEDGSSSPLGTTPACSVAEDPMTEHEMAMTAYEPAPLSGECLTGASIGRSVDDALTALLGATQLVQHGLGSAALVIGPLDGISARQQSDMTALTDIVPDPTARPAPPPSSAARGKDYKPPSGLITIVPGSRPNTDRRMMSTMNARPRAIKATVVPPMPVVRSPQL